MIILSARIFLLASFFLISVTFIEAQQNAAKAQQNVTTSYLKAVPVPTKSKEGKTQISVKIDPRTIETTKITKIVLFDKSNPGSSQTKDVGEKGGFIFFEVPIKSGNKNEFSILIVSENIDPLAGSADLRTEELGRIEGVEADMPGTVSGGPTNNNPQDTQPEQKKLKSENAVFKLTNIESYATEMDYNLVVTPDVEKLKTEKIIAYAVTVTHKDANNNDKSETDRFTVQRKDDEAKTFVPSQIIPLKLHSNKNIVEVVAESEKGPIKDAQAIVSIYCVKCEESIPINNLYTRAIVGFQQVGASSSDNTQKPFVNFFFTAPIIRSGAELKKIDPKDPNSPYRINYPFPRVSLWGDLRFTSVAQQTLSNTGLANFSNGFSFGEKGEINELVQSFEVLAGLEIKIHEPERPFSFFGTSQKTVVSLIGSAGFSNPLTSSRSAQVFRVPKINGADDPKFLEAFQDAKGKTNIAFIQDERDRFYRQYFGGLRFRTMYYDKDGSPLNRSPAIFDVSIGQNESITSKLSGVILRLDGFYPFPVKSADFLYLFGNAQLKLGKQIGTKSFPFILEPVANFTLPNNDTAIVQNSNSPFLRSNRDRYSIGLGLDFIKLYKRLSGSSSAK